MKKTVIIATLAIFSLSTLIMPYANFDDTKSLQAVYNNCLKQDADMDFFEFVAEKLLVAGFDPFEDEEENSTHPNQPIHGATIVQIQTGVYHQQPVAELDLKQPEIISLPIPLTNTAILSQDFHQGIFHPPSRV